MAQLTLLLLQLNMYKKDWWWNYILVYSPLTEPKLLFPALLCSPKMRNLQMFVCDLLKELQNLVTTDVFSVETIFLWNRCWISFKVTLYVVWSQWISLYTVLKLISWTLNSLLCWDCLTLNSSHEPRELAHCEVTESLKRTNLCEYTVRATFKDTC